MEESNSKVKIVWKQLPLKYKLIIIGVGIAFLFIVMFLILLITPLIELGIIDVSSGYSSIDGYGYSNIGSSTEYWWPIGSIETTTKGGKEFASGEPEDSVITSYFGLREDPFNPSEIRYHNGTDIANNRGSGVTNIIAIKDGKVITAQNTPGCNSNGINETGVCGTGYGNYIEIEHSDGTVSLYGHLHQNTIKVKVGDVVKQGQVIAKMGSSGRSTGSHLHLEIFINGVGQDALNYVFMDNPRPVGKYNIGTISSSGSASDNKKAICQALVSAGYSKDAVAGMLVNIGAEGGFLTNNMEGCYEDGECCFDGTYGMCTKSANDPLRKFGSDEKYTSGVDSGAYPQKNFANDGVGYGLIQWTSSGRKNGLYNAAKTSNKSIADLGVQFNYLLEEIKKYPVTLNAISDETKSAYNVANIFCQDFESPANEEYNCPNRAKENASDYLAYVKNGCK